MICGSEKLVSDCFLVLKLDLAATVVPKRRKMSQNVAKRRVPSQTVPNCRYKKLSPELSSRIPFLHRIFAVN